MTSYDKSASDLVNEVKAAFSECLRSQMRKADMSTSRLSRMSGISRSVISGYLSDDPSLPNAINLIRLASALGCPPGLFLPCQTPGTQGTTITDEMQLIPARSHDERLRETLDVIASATTQFVYYAPISIPDPLKTEALFNFEYQTAVGGELKTYVQTIRGMVDLPLNGAILLDEAMLTDLLEQRGLYKDLPRHMAEAQLRHLISFSEARFPEWQIKVIRRLEFQITPCFLLSNTLLLQEFFDYITLIRNKQAIHRVQSRLTEALRAGVDLLDWLPPSARNATRQAGE
jgi:transcriptional regulator with XRE-family HTH domain